MDLAGRLEIIKQCSATTDSGYEDLLTIINIFQQEYGIELTEENGAVMITHLAAAFKRIETGEVISSLDSGLVQQIKEDAIYPKAKEIADNIFSKIQNKLSDEEKDFLLVHVGTLLIEQGF